MEKEKVIEESDRLLEIVKKRTTGADNDREFEIALQQAMSIIKFCYGENCEQFELLLATKNSFTKIPYSDYTYNIYINILGVLTRLKYDLENNLIKSIQKQVAGEVFADLLSLAKELANEGQKEASAVLACGAFEDCLKKFASDNQLNVDDASLSDIINGLKSQSLLKNPQATVAKSLIQIRNNAFHANWDKIEMVEIKSLIAFTEEFILQNF